MNQKIQSLVEVRGFKWPKRPTEIASTRLLGEDSFGRWLGVRRGEPWHAADGSRSGVMLESFVKLVPQNTWWTACFNPVDPVVDVDIVLPVQWTGNVLEEVDLELDILRLADGSVHVRDQDTFARVRAEWGMPDAIANEAEATCQKVRTLVERGTEPFGLVCQKWLTHFLTEIEPFRTIATKVRG